MPDTPLQPPSYTCDTLPAPQNIQVRLPHRFPRSPAARSPSPNLDLPHIDTSFSTAFDVPTTEEVFLEHHHSEPSASPSFHKSVLDVESVSPQPPARKLCVRHQRMADEGTIIKLQQVCPMPLALRYYFRRKVEYISCLFFLSIYSYIFQ